MSLLFVLGLGMLPALASPVLACEPTDLKCVVSDVEKTVGGAGETASDVVEEVEEAASETVDQVEEAAGDLGEEAGEAVPRTVGIPDDPAPNPPAEEPGGASGSTSPSAEPRDRVRGTRERGPTAPGGSGGPGTASARPSLPVLRPADLAVASSEPSAPLAQSEDAPEDDLAEVIQRFSFPLLLSAVVALFLFFQGRVDRRDPKLTRAPLEDETLLFG